MAIDGTNDELSSTAAAGGRWLQLDNGLGRWGAPKFMLGLIGCFGHKETLLLSISQLRQANRQINLLQRRQMQRGWKANCS
jgi:hypothetical protein